MSSWVSRISRASIPRTVLVAVRCPVFAAVATLASPCPAQVVVLTVGPHGSSSTIQGALAGVVSGWVNDVRIESGTFVENVVVESPAVSFTSGELHFSGGWNAGFTSQTANPALTTVDGGSSGSCLRINPTLTSAATITVSNLTVTHGHAETGGGIFVSSSADHVTVMLRDLVFTQNVAAAVGSAGAYGGGLHAVIAGTQCHLRVRGCSFSGNLAQASADGGAQGGGAAIELDDDFSSVGVELSTFENNTLACDVWNLGAGLYLTSPGNNVTWVIGVEFTANEVLPIPGATAAGAGLYAALGTPGSESWLMLRELRLLNNTCLESTGYQAEMYFSGTSRLDAGDILAAGGRNGVKIDAQASADVAATNVTATDNISVGFRFAARDPTVTANLQNTLLYGNSVNLQVVGSITADHNLVGVNPHFVDPGAQDYRLSAGSPAENAGTNSPAPGLGDTDCVGGVRLIDATVDIGAYEGVDLIFSDGVGWGHTGRWSATVGAD